MPTKLIPLNTAIIDTPLISFSILWASEACYARSTSISVIVSIESRRWRFRDDRCRKRYVHKWHRNQSCRWWSHLRWSCFQRKQMSSSLNKRIRTNHSRLQGLTSVAMSIQIGHKAPTKLPSAGPWTRQVRSVDLQIYDDGWGVRSTATIPTVAVRQGALVALVLR